MTNGPVTLHHLDDGAFWRVTIGGSRGNVIDAAVMDALARVFDEAMRAPALRAICLEGQGAHFSFGASVQEHLPDQVAGMLRRFHALLLALVDTSVVVLAAVRGQCLGGGLEIVTLCHRVFAARDTRLGQPEIQLGVFAPAASLLLAERVGRARAEDLCLTGRTVGADEALAMGLVDQVTDGDPAEEALGWARKHLVPRSASSLRFAVQAVRADLRRRLVTELPAIERLYLEDLMPTHDAVEGLTAFLEKRAPAWRHA
jgi:cyclohexa-1,5-dienecarbonyl-CoA hydratase